MNLFANIGLTLSLALFTFAWADTNSCEPGKNAQLLYRKHVYREAFKGLAQDVYVAYPKDSDTSSTYVDIVDFCVLHHDPKLYAAKAVFAYSVEEDFDRHLGKATIILQGEESRGINSTVEFYGFKK